MLVTKLLRNTAINVQLNIKHHGGWGWECLHQDVHATWG